MRHMEGCENVFSASWSEKEKPAPVLLAPAIRESVNKISHQKNNFILGQKEKIVDRYCDYNNLLCRTLNYGCGVTGLHQRIQIALLPKSKRIKL